MALLNNCISSRGFASGRRIFHQNEDRLASDKKSGKQLLGVLSWRTVMGMIATQDQLGIGIYTAPEAAFYARVSRRMMSRWVFGESGSKPVIERELKDSEERVVTFLDFIQTLAVREVRYRHKLPLQRIRQGVEEAQKRYDLKYPLACEHRIFLFSDQQRQGHGEIVIRLESDQEGVEEYVQLTGRAKHNRLIQPVVEMFLSDLSFDPVTQLATQYRPMQEDGRYVLLDPHRRFGEPLIQPGGYTAEALWHATNTEGSMEAAAEAYGVTVAEVRLANRYYDSLLTHEPE